MFRGRDKHAGGDSTSASSPRAQAMLRSDVPSAMAYWQRRPPWVSEQAIRARGGWDGRPRRRGGRSARSGGRGRLGPPGVRMCNNLSVRMPEPPGRRERLALEPEVRPEER